MQSNTPPRLDGDYHRNIPLVNCLQSWMVCRGARQSSCRTPKGQEPRVQA